MEEICREAETDTPLQSSVVTSLPASAGNNSRGLWSQSIADKQQVQGRSTNTSTEEEDSNDGDDQGEYDDEEESENSGVNDDTIEKDTARMENN